MTQRRKTHRRILHRLALASLAALCIGAPVASAAPIDPPGTGATTTQDPRQQDMHASTVQPAASAERAPVSSHWAVCPASTSLTGAAPSDTALPSASSNRRRIR